MEHHGVCAAVQGIPQPNIPRACRACRGGRLCYPELAISSFKGGPIKKGIQMIYSFEKGADQMICQRPRRQRQGIRSLSIATECCCLPLLRNWCSKMTSKITGIVLVRHSRSGRPAKALAGLPDKCRCRGGAVKGMILGAWFVCQTGLGYDGSHCRHLCHLVWLLVWRKRLSEVDSVQLSTLPCWRRAVCRRPSRETGRVAVNLIPLTAAGMAMLTAVERVCSSGSKGRQAAGWRG